VVSEQKLFGCTNGAPGLYINRTKSDAKGLIIQIYREYWRFEALELHFAVKDAT
jgi:DNA-binding GntR family transcriptional regulator